MRSRRPEPKRVDCPAPVTDDRTIERNSDQTGRPACDRVQGTTAYFDRAVELYIHRLVRARNLPRVGSTQPIGGNLLLPAVLDRLLENAVLVSQTIAHRRDLHRRHRIEKASSEAAKSAVTQPRVGLLLQQLEPIKVLLLDEFSGNWIEEEVCDVVGQRAANEKFHREVINAFRILALIGLVGTYPSLRKDITHRAGEGFKTLARADLRSVYHVVKHHVSLIERLVRSSELNRPAAVLLNELLCLVSCWCRGN